MDIIKELISSQGGKLVEQLTQSGFSAEQADQFIPEASNSIIDAIKDKGVGAIADGSASSLMDSININGLASKLGIESGLAQNGMQSILPIVLSFLQNKSGGLSGVLSMLGGKDAGGLANMAKGFFK